MGFIDLPIEVFASNVDASLGGICDLRWTPKQPDFGGPTWPFCVVSHEGGYKAGNPGNQNSARDMASAGYFAVCVEYRLAPPAGPMVRAGPPGDPQVLSISNGRTPMQTNDSLAAVLAARADPRCNGQVVWLGGSSGGGHGLWVNFAGVIGTSRPDALVCLSGIYDLDDVTSNTDPGTSEFGSRNPTYRDNIGNYVGADYGSPPFDAAAVAGSPYWLSNFTAAQSAPILFIASSTDTIPPNQFNKLAAKLTANSIPFESIWRDVGDPNGYDPATHGFMYWNDPTTLGGTFPIVKDYVLDFFNRALTHVTPPPPPGVPTLIRIR